MGLTNKTTQSINFLKIKGLKKEEKEHYFELNKERSELKNFTGKLIKAKADSYEYEGEQKQTMKLMFVDEGEFYQLDGGYNSITRGFINSIIGYIEKQPTKKGRLDMALSLYINKDGYKQLGLQINGERGEWKYSIDEQKALTEEILNKTGKLISRDYSAYDEVLKGHLADINNYIDIQDFEEEKKVEEKVETEENTEEPKGEDLPF